MTNERLRTALETVANWQTHGPLKGRDAEAMVEVARAALADADAPLDRRPRCDYACASCRMEPVQEAKGER